MILHYKINKIETKQFAVFPENYRIDQSVNIKSSFAFNIKNDYTQIRCISKLQYVQDDRIILVLEFATYFDIAPDGSENIKLSKTIHVDFLRYMATIAVGTARGIIYAKSENTIVNSIILPPINLVDAITEDLEIE